MAKDIRDMPTWSIILPRDSMSHIPRRIRAGAPLGGSNYHKCDVCWTCKFFNCVSYECNRFPKSEYKYISWPETFRCSYWKE
jgi:hypothetical protein